MKDKASKSRWGALKSALQGQRSTAEDSIDKEGATEGKTGHPAGGHRLGDQPQLDARDDQARLAALYRVSRVLGTSLDLDEVLAQVIDAVIGLTGAERGLLVLIDGDAQDWKLRVARNFDEENLSHWEAEISRTIISTAVTTRQGVVTEDAQSDTRFSQQASVIFNVLRSIMCTPLLARGRVIGAIYVDSRIQKGIFNEEDLELMDAFATQAAFAIDNARIYTRTVQKVQQLSIELDEARKARQVAEITETEYFRRLKERVEELRNRTSKS
jgi:GAF domain-containing protein